MQMLLLHGIANLMQIWPAFQDLIVECMRAATAAITWFATATKHS